MELNTLLKKAKKYCSTDRPIDFSAVMLYFNDPATRTRIFSERLGQFTTFTKLATGIYQSKIQETGVSNTYHYKNGAMYELEMSKGASVFLKLIR